jgi:hypothetical protein
MVDLPLHGMQISIWKNLSDPRYGFADFYDLHYFTPYFGFYALARVFAGWTSVLVAMKLAVSASVLALPLSLMPLLGRTSASRWWSLLGFPLAYGYSFDWGFTNFMMATPIAFLYLTFVVDYARAPTRRGGAALAVFTVALFWAHGLLVLFCPLLAGVIVLSQGRADGTHGRRLVLMLAPLASPVPAMIVWYLLDRHRGHEPTAWQAGPGRLYDLFSLSDLGPPALATGSIVITGLVIALRNRDPSRAKITGLAYAVAVATVLLGPGTIVGTVRITPRFGVFVLPLLVAWLGPSAPRAVRAALVAGVVAWMALLVVRFRSFDRDAHDYEDVAATIGPRPCIRPVIFIETVSDVPFLHLPAWTQAEKGGLYGLTFATAFPIGRNLPGSPEVMSQREGWESDRFDWRRELVKRYDTYVVRSSLPGAALTRRLFDGAGDRVKLLAERGMWHVYAARRAPSIIGPF